MNKSNPTGENANRPVPVLMVPLRRCGSHALRLRLNFNPQFYSPYPLHIVDFVPLLPLYGDLDDDRAYFRLVSDVIGLQAVSMVKWPGVVFDPVEIFEAIRHEPRSVHRIVWELLQRSGEARGARIVMDKSLDSVHYADELMRLMPAMRFLNVVRDPRAQIASMNKAIIHDFDTLLNTRTWVEAHRAADLLIERYPERVMTIRYEDFLHEQEATLRKVCGFFGIDYLPQMLDVSRSAEAKQISQMSALWSSNCFAPIPANIDKYKAQLSIEEITVIETLTARQMRRYGYEFATHASVEIDPSAFDAARRLSDERKHEAWRTLEATNFRDYVLRRQRAEYLAAVRARMEDLRASTKAADVASRHRLEELVAPFEVTD
jgi:hypothetical protein